MKLWGLSCDAWSLLLMDWNCWLIEGEAATVDFPFWLQIHVLLIGLRGRGENVTKWPYNSQFKIQFKQRKLIKQSLSWIDCTDGCLPNIFSVFFIYTGKHWIEGKYLPGWCHTSDDWIINNAQLEWFSYTHPESSSESLSENPDFKSRKFSWWSNGSTYLNNKYRIYGTTP